MREEGLTCLVIVFLLRGFDVHFPVRACRLLSMMLACVCFSIHSGSEAMVSGALMVYAYYAAPFGKYNKIGKGMHTKTLPVSTEAGSPTRGEQQVTINGMRLGFVFSSI